MNRIPQHKASQYSEYGVVLHRFSSLGSNHTPVSYAHQDDFYVFGLLTKGTACGIIDFKELHLKEGDVFFVPNANYQVPNLWQKIKNIKTVETLLPLLLLATIVTGIKLHVAGHIAGQAAWHVWLVSHVVSTIIFTVFTLWHIAKRKK